MGNPVWETQQCPQRVRDGTCSPQQRQSLTHTGPHSEQQVFAPQPEGETLNFTQSSGQKRNPNPYTPHSGQPWNVASSNSLIFIFRIDAEANHQTSFQNILSDTTWRAPDRRASLCQIPNILKWCLAVRLCIKPKNKYFAICSRKI